MDKSQLKANSKAAKITGSVPFKHILHMLTTNTCYSQGPHSSSDCLNQISSWPAVLMTAPLPWVAQEGVHEKIQAFL
jgi:hypothetical protein